MLTKDEVEEFKALVLEANGIELMDSEAEEQSFRLISLFEFIIRQNKTKVVNQSNKVIQKQKQSKNGK